MTKPQLETAWWVERDDGERIVGPFTTQQDAQLARFWVEVERALMPETFWVRGYGLNRAGTEYVRLADE